jgi:hypothetical protein
MPIAERMLAALACRTAYRNLRVSCDLDRPSRRVRRNIPGRFCRPHGAKAYLSIWLGVQPVAL